MTTFQLDQCLDSKRFAHDCTAEGLCHTLRLPPSLRNAADPELLAAVQRLRIFQSASLANRCRNFRGVRIGMPSMALKSKKVMVAGDDHVCLANQSGFDELVIVRIWRLSQA